MRSRLVVVMLFAVLAWSVGRAQSRPDATSRWKPVSFEILEDWDKGDDLHDVEADFDLFNELDIHTWRGSLGWDDFEPEHGREDFAWLHQFADLAARHHIDLRPYIGYTPGWAARAGTNPKDAWHAAPARIDDWERFAGDLASAMAKHPNVRSFEIYNEENAKQWWDGSAEDYARLLVSGSRAIRAHNPGASVLFGGLVYPDVDWTTRVCRVPGAAASFGVIPIHSYVESWLNGSVEHYLDQLQPFLDAVDRACGRKTIWLNEIGFPTAGGRTERDQANWWVRAVATFLAHPRIEEIGVYEIKDLRLGSASIGDAFNYHLGITYSDRRKKMAFGTIDMLTDLLDTGTIRVDDDTLAVTVVNGTAGDLHQHLFTRPDGDRILIAWDRASSPAVTLSVPAVASVTEYDVSGRVLGSNQTASVLTRVALTRGVPRIFRLRPLRR